MRRRPTGLELGVLAAVLALGVLALPTPATGDQALFLVGAREMAHGATYYRDFWDIKQPGIYWFYELARPLGGGILAVHVLELVWQLGLAVLLQRAGRGLFRRPAVGAVLPLLVVGVYYASARPVNLTLIEGLVGLPLLGSLLLVWRAARSQRLALFAVAGLVGGVVPVFKVVEGALLLVVLVSGLVRLRQTSASRAEQLRAAAAYAAGAALPAVGVLGWALARHELRLLVRTTLVYPPQVSALAGMHTTYELHVAARQVATSGTLLLALAVVALLPGVGRRLDLMTLSCLAWIAVGGGVILLQKPNAYEVFLLLVPVGLLAAAGLQRVLDVVAERPRVALRAGLAVAGLALLLPTLSPLAAEVRVLGEHGGGVTSADRVAVGDAETDEYADTSADLAAVHPLLPPGPVYVLGHPLLQQLLGAPSALELNGWSPEQFVPQQWREWQRELERTHPTVVFVDHGALPLVQQGAPEAMAYLRAHYRVVRTSPAADRAGGTWWVTSLPPGPVAPHADGTRL